MESVFGSKLDFSFIWVMFNKSLTTRASFTNSARQLFFCSFLMGFETEARVESGGRANRKQQQSFSAKTWSQKEQRQTCCTERLLDTGLKTRVSKGLQEKHCFDLWPHNSLKQSRVKRDVLMNFSNVSSDLNELSKQPFCKNPTGFTFISKKNNNS